jgi:hypothetical protein
MPAPRPFTVASGSFTAAAAPLPTLTTDCPAADRNTSVFETSSSAASAAISWIRTASCVRPIASNDP